jgi:hypothetical protein
VRRLVGVDVAGGGVYVPGRGEVDDLVEEFDEWPRAFSQARTASRSYSGLDSEPPAGAGKSSCRRRQLLTVARVAPAMREISAAVTWGRGVA